MTTEATPQEAGAATTEAGGQQTTAEGTTPEAGNAGAASEQTTTPDTPVEIVYEFKAPEGITLDQARLDEFTAIAKELKLPADKAQAVVDLATKVEIQRAEEHAAMVAKWTDEIANDKVLGGDKLSETLATAKKVYSLLPAEEAESFKQMLQVSGYGSHPSMVRLLHAVGTALSEDKFVTGGAAPAGSEQGVAQRMYPNMNP